MRGLAGDMWCDYGVYTGPDAKMELVVVLCVVLILQFEMMVALLWMLDLHGWHGIPVRGRDILIAVRPHRPQLHQIFVARRHYRSYSSSIIADLEPSPWPMDWRQNLGLHTLLVWRLR